MVSVNATAAYCRAALIMLHDYLLTMGNLNAVEGSTVAGKSNHGRKYQSERLRNSEATSVKSGNSAHHLRPRWTHNHHRFADLSVVHRKLHRHHKILVFFISRTFIDLARHRDLTTSRVFVVNRHLHRRDIEILINIAPPAAY